MAGSCWEVYVVHKAQLGNTQLPIAHPLIQMGLIILIITWLVPKKSLGNMRLNVVQVLIFEMYKHWQEIHIERFYKYRKKEFYTLAHLNIVISCTNVLGLFGNIYSIYSSTSMILISSLIVLIYVWSRTLSIERIFGGKILPFESFFISVTPAGVHPLLCIIMVPLEIIGILIRPISMGLRMNCNLMSGFMILHNCEGVQVHLQNPEFIYNSWVSIMEFVTNCGWMIINYPTIWCAYSFILTILITLLMLPLLLGGMPLILAVLSGFEVFVACAQGYIYCRLISQFLSEVGTVH